jgi:hypothetical protein
VSAEDRELLYSIAVTIGYLEAWRLWFSGQQLPSDAVLWFMTLRWWARAGKIATFLGGATVLLDLAGPDRLRAVGRSRRLKAVPGELLEKSPYLAGTFWLLIATPVSAILLFAQTGSTASCGRAD